MQNRKQRYFGMTLIQLVILICLGAAALGVMGVMAYMVMGNVASSNAAPDQPAQADLATAEPSATFTPLASDTPVLPSPTFTATTYESLIPAGWQQQKYKNIEFWVPAEFGKSSSSTDLVGLINKTPGTQGIKVVIDLSNETGVTTDLETVVLKGVSEFTHDVTYLERKDFAIGTYEAKRLKVEVIITNIPMEAAVYFIKDGSTVWTITTLCHLSDFHTWLPVFDQVARTFRINP